MIKSVVMQPQRTILITLVAALALLGCGRDSLVEQTCTDSWARRTSGLARCDPGKLCTQLEGQPEREVSVVINLLADHLSEAHRLENWNCMTSTLRVRGVTKIEPRTSSFDVFVTAKWPQVRDLLQLELVNGIELGCRTGDVCNHCDGLSLEACAQDALCVVVHGVPVNVDRMCVKPPTPVACISAGSACTDAISFARDPQGQCWQFGSGCRLGEGWHADAPECRPEDTGQFEPCR